MSKAKILIVDDDPLILALISRKLGAGEYDCQVADSGAQALKVLEFESFDLVLLDVKMPGMTGMELLEIIRLHYVETAVIMITAQKEVETAVHSMQLGAYDYVVKPVDLTLLEMTITRALERRKLLLENMSYQVALEEKVEETDQDDQDSVPRFHYFTGLRTGSKGQIYQRTFAESDVYCHGDSQGNELA